jgi:hypothetical protein
MLRTSADLKLHRNYVDRKSEGTGGGKICSINLKPSTLNLDQGCGKQALVMVGVPLLLFL